MNKLLFYYSLSGNGDLVASYLSEKGYELRKIETVKNKPKKNFFNIFILGFKAGLRKCAKLKEYNKSIVSYDEIVIASPVWNSNFSTPINTILKEVDFLNKKVTFVLFSGSGEAKGAVKRIYKEFPASNTIVLKEPIENKKELEKLGEL